MIFVIADSARSRLAPLAADILRSPLFNSSLNNALIHPNQLVRDIANNIHFSKQHHMLQEGPEEGLIEAFVLHGLSKLLSRWTFSDLDQLITELGYELRIGIVKNELEG